MELLSVIQGLRTLTRPCRVRVHLDSNYVKKAFTESWLAAWERKDWVTSRSGRCSTAICGSAYRWKSRVTMSSGSRSAAMQASRSIERVDKLAVAACSAQRR